MGRPTRHPPRSSEDTGLDQPPDISLQMTDSDWTCKHDPARAPCSTAARSRQRLLCKCGLATTHATLGPSKHPSVSRPTRTGPMPRRDKVTTSPVQRATTSNCTVSIYTATRSAPLPAVSLLNSTVDGQLPFLHGPSHLDNYSRAVSDLASSRLHAHCCIAH